MRKYILLILSCILIFTLCACGTSTTNSSPTPVAVNESFTPVGTWVLDTDKNANTDLRLLFGSLIGQTGGVLEINNDGTLQITVGSYGGSGTWTDNGDSISTIFRDWNENEEQSLTIYKVDDITQKYLKAQIYNTDIYFVKSTETSATANATISKPTQAATPTPMASATPIPQATTEIVNVNTDKKVSITKNPTGETLTAGGSATFIARAENAQSIVWIIVSPDAKTTYPDAKDATNEFPGLKVEGQGTEKLVLSNVPIDMNGYRVQCYFTGEGGPVYTSGAYLTVNKTGSTSNVSEIAKACKQTVKKYADYSNWTISDIENYISDTGAGYDQFQITLTRGAVTLVCQFKGYTSENASYPESLTWYDSNNQMNKYVYGKEDSEAWNHFEKTILDITNNYGNGTAGQTIQ